MSTYLISRKPSSSSYSIWQFSFDGNPQFEQLPVDPSASFDPNHRLAQVGGFMLEWGPATAVDSQKLYPYRLFTPDINSKDPLNGKSVQQGYWDVKKFWGYRAHYSEDVHEQDHIPLISLGNFMLFFVGGRGRGTYMLYNFDPNLDKPNTSDPIPNLQVPQGGFPTIQAGHELIRLGNYVLDRHNGGKSYRLWSFDPQNPVPLSIPAIKEGEFDQIGPDHQLLAVDGKILSWIPGSGEFSLWEVNPLHPQPFKALVKRGKFPKEMGDFSSLVSYTGKSTEADSSKPGTMAYMRSKIKHVVFYMAESRSFDNVVGLLYDKNQKDLNTIGSHEPFEGVDPKFFNLKGEEKVYPSLFKDGVLSDQWDLSDQTQDPFHDNSDGLQQMFYTKKTGYAEKAKPDMKGFVANNPSTGVMLTLTPDQLPILNGLAKNFAISDRWFSSVPGGTDINRAFSMCGSGMNRLDTWEGGSLYANWPQYPHRASVWKVLLNQGIKDWKIFNAIQWNGHPFTYHLYLEGQAPSIDSQVGNYIDSVDNFKAQASQGNLPAFSFIEPVWMAPNGTTSYHPGMNLVPAERSLNDIYETLKNSPAWEETLLVVTFSKPGGLCDHVAPPYAAKPWPNDCTDGFRFDLLGPRVPAIFVSPWVSPKTVIRSGQETPFDSTSFISTLLNWFGIPKSQWGLGDRVDQSPTFEQVLQQTSPRKDAPNLDPPYDKSFPKQ
ncbi:phospholipase C [Algoriphagus boseongensis]|uniref:Phospholipase C n=1 Tax=Algoriphagus boseongensis TaxID=1442587 RepID=A0A4R6T8A6_9BACT|nr:alkaline phosphatase family protein [Algoriphagus boseongensis]TDQ19478.1 phospholipase C [Algoriphagus boseongensis]